MNNDRIAAIRERCEAIQIITPNQARKDLIQAKKDMTDLLTEIDRLNSELFGKTEQLEAAKSELLQKTQLLDASQRRERAAVKLIGNLETDLNTISRAREVWHTMGIMLQAIELWRDHAAEEGEHS